MVRTLLRERPAGAPGPSPNGSTPAPLSLAAAKRRRPSWVVAGVVLVAVAALLGAWVFAATSDTMRVVVAAQDLAPGEVVTAADLRVVELGRSGGLRAIRPEQQDLILGAAARGPVPAGTVLNTDLFSDREQVIPAGEVVVGAALIPGAAPTAGLAAGDRVAVVGVAKATGAEQTAPVARVLTTGTVWSVEQPAASGSSAGWWVSLLIPEEAQTAVAQAASEGLLRLSMLGAAE